MSARVQVNYKSGKSMIFDVKTFTVRRSGGSTEFEWESSGKGGVRPLMFGADDVESVWEL